MEVIMLKVGDTVKWMKPLDHDYFYGEIVSIRNHIATIKGIGFYRYITAEVHFRYIKKVAGGGNYGGGKRAH
jgi:hypothetical protein